MGHLKTLAAVAVAGTLGGMLTGFAALDSHAVNAVETVEAIQRIAPDAITDADGTAVPAGTDTAVMVVNDFVRVTVPTDPSDGIRMAGDEIAALTIELPFANLAGDAVASQVPGVVVYDNHNGSSTVPVLRQDGSVQISTVIDNASAPKRYSYQLNLHAGQSLRLNGDGSVAAIDAAGASAVHIAAPWARDATGEGVPTHYELDGDTLTQIVAFTADTTFPIVADPTVIQTVYTYSRADVERMWSTYSAMGTICNLIPGLNYMASLLCPGGARLRDVVNSAHYQKKRVKATFNNCGFTYCNYYDYVVVT